MKLASPFKALIRPEMISASDSRLVSAARELAERLHLPKTLTKFLIVGGIAFWIYQAGIYAFYDSPVFWFMPEKDHKVDLALFTLPDLRLLIASVVAVELAILFQFNAHERWTFRQRPRSGWVVKRLVKFQLSSIVSPTIIVAATNGLTHWLGWSPYFSGAAGVLLGFGWNWGMNSLVIWPHQSREAPTETPV